MERQADTRNWHLLSTEEILHELDSSLSSGLTTAEAVRRLKRHGPNELSEKDGRTVWSILAEQAGSTMSLILSGAALLSLLIGSFKDAGTIMAIVVLFVLLGFVQDYRAERALAALRQLAKPQVRVRRDATVHDAPAAELVPGDIVLLEAGSVVPADCRVLEAHSVNVQEALLTGESEAVAKQSAALDIAELPLGDRRNMLFMGTVLSSGRAVAVVTATGMGTELGRIATLLQEVGKEWTPLQKRLDHLGKVLAVVAIVVALCIFLIGLLRGEGLREMLLMAVSVAVAAIPEGLPAVVTITLAIGAQRMLGRRALIRRLPAVETLGSVTVICSDKTGTLTQNRMTVTGLVPATVLLTVDRVPDKSGDELLLVAATLCNDAVLKGDTEEAVALGDPTEGALLQAAAKAGLFREDLEQLLPRSAEIPFDSVSRRMITVHSVTGSELPAALDSLHLQRGGTLLAAKGALDTLLPLCDRIMTPAGTATLQDSHRAILQEEAEQLASDGQRVLALALRPLNSGENDQLDSLQQRFVYVGLTALHDPPRQEAADAVRTCLAAGIRPVMITGDHPLTARAIARQVGIDGASGALTGIELDRLSDEEFEAAVEQVSIYARVAPEHKLRIVESLKHHGGVVAMTGDGVNDAPALKRADVGVAMGKVGTDVAREAADMVLLDDNFATIVAAVEEGRTIYDNIRKFVLFSVAGNTGKILCVLLLPFAGMPMPLTPLQLLWLNLLTDGLLGLGMGVERPEPDLMQRRPIAPGSQIFDARSIKYVLGTGALIGATCMAVSWQVWRSGGPWQTVLFVSLATAQIAQALALRSFRSSLLRMGLFSNPLLLAMVGSVLLLQALVVYLPQLQLFFSTTALVGIQLWLILVPAILVLLVLEGEKLFLQRPAPQ